MRTLPLEGAPLAVPGPYQVTQEAAFDNPGFIVYRPVALGAFPEQDSMPLLVWGNGGCNIDGRGYGGILSTVASYGFIAMATIPVEPEEGEEARRNATADDLLNAITWAEQEAIREGSHLRGKIDITQIAAMGVSCGGFRMAAVAGLDPRVDSVGLLNTGVSDTSELAGLHGPVLIINGGEVDFMYETARANFEAINHVPVFYGARENAGHSATYPHPGGGEFANVVSDWLRYQFKGDQQARQTFVGENNCSLCTNDTWETASKGLE
jgi:dienelactone hydrolase